MAEVPSFALRMPRRFLRGDYVRVGLTVLALALGVQAVCALDLTGRATLNAFVEIVDTMAGRAALQISAGEGASFPQDVVSGVTQIPGVELAVPVVSATAFAADGSGELLTVHGMDVSDDKVIRVYDLQDRDDAGFDDPKLLLPDAVILTRAFAGERGLGLGMPIDLDTPRGRQRFTVRGLLDPEGLARAYSGNLVVMDLAAAQEAFGNLGVINRLDVVVGRGESVPRVADAIAAVLPPGLQVEAPAQRKGDLHKVMDAYRALLDALALVELVAAFMIAFSSLTTLYEGRAWQLGVLRAVGVRQSAAWWELVKEAFLIGVGGVMVGVPAGIGIAHVILPLITTSAGLNAKLIVPEATLSIAPVSLALAIVLGLGTAILAAALPAWRTARSGIAVAMRLRGSEQPGTGRKSLMLVRAALAGSLVVTLGLQAARGTAVWGLAATVLLAVAAALAARPLLRLVGPLLLKGARGVDPTAQLAVKNLIQSPRRTSLTLAMIGVGLGAVVWLWSVAHSFKESVIDEVTQMIRADITVSSAHILGGFFEAPIEERIVDELRAIPGVRAVAAMRTIDWRYEGGPVTFTIFDAVYFTSHEFGRLPLIGRGSPGMWETVARGEGAVMSSAFGANLGKRVGDVVTIDTPGGPLSLPIVGVAALFESPRGTLVISRELYKRYWHDSRVTRTFVLAAPGAAAIDIHKAIAGTLGRKHSLRLLSSAEMAAYFAEQVRRAFAGLYVLDAVMLFMVLVGVADTLTVGVLERVREIGCIRAIGVRRRSVRRMVLIESVVLGCLGVALGGAAGYALGTLWIEATFPALLGYVLIPHFPFARAGALAAATLGVCVLAAYFPARRAAGLEPAGALRYE